MTAVNSAGSTVSDAATVSAELTESESAIWTAVKTSIAANAGLSGITLAYSRIALNTYIGSGSQFILYPLLSFPQESAGEPTHLSLVVAGHVRQFYSGESDETTLASNLVLTRDAIATTPLLETWLDTPVIGTDDESGFTQPNLNYSVIEAFLDFKVAIV